MPSEENGSRELLSPSNPATAGKGQMEASHECIRRQLALILASPAFRNSKRYSAVLNYLVELTLGGHAEQLKERNIGVDIFNRAADYDTATDHVVRSAGSEIRKRLAQYYSEHGQEAAIRIDLYPGSYVPQFRPSDEGPRGTPDRKYPEGPGLKTEDVRPQSSRNMGRWLVLFAAFSAGAVLALSVTLLVSRRPQTALDRFWAPLISQSGPVSLCVGYPRSIGINVPQAPAAGGATNFVADPDGSRLHVGWEDAMALARIAGTLQAEGKHFRVFTELSATFDDLRQGPGVLIGANNGWVLRIIGGLRFQLEEANERDRIFIRDSQNPSQGGWHPIRSAGSGEYTRDYAIVARCWNPDIGQMFVVATGTHLWGTRAAGEFLTNAAHLSRLESLAQKNRNRQNVEVVLSTDVVKGMAGPPNIVAAHFW
jgi:hypothetical protein